MRSMNAGDNYDVSNNFLKHALKMEGTKWPLILQLQVFEFAAHSSQPLKLKNVRWVYCNMSLSDNANRTVALRLLMSYTLKLVRTGLISANSASDTCTTQATGGGRNICGWRFFYCAPYPSQIFFLCHPIIVDTVHFGPTFKESALKPTVAFRTGLDRRKSRCNPPPGAEDWLPQT